jgi:hypothetical protein
VPDVSNGQASLGLFRELLGGRGSCVRTLTVGTGVTMGEPPRRLGVRDATFEVVL